MTALEQVYATHLKRYVDYASDKGTAHSYIPVYGRILEPRRSDPIHLLEVGVDKGSSLSLWASYFENSASITGIDVDLKKTLYTQAKSKALVCDSTDAVAVNKLFGSQFFDVIIDDGNHEPFAQLKTMLALLLRLQWGGHYFVEDIVSPEAALALKNLAAQINPALTGRIYDFRANRRRGDDIILHLH